jgi:hypothetical protein
MVAVSATAAPVAVAITRKVPWVPPAVYEPPLVMVPPVALQVTVTARVLPSEYCPVTE